MTDKTSESQTNWRPCNGGEISSLVSTLRAAKAKRQRITFGKQAGAVLACAFLIGMLIRPSSQGEPDYGGVTCSQVVSNTDNYLLLKLDPDLASSIDIHRKQCPLCDQHILKRANELDIKITWYHIKDTTAHWLVILSHLPQKLLGF